MSRSRGAKIVAALLWVAGLAAIVVGMGFSAVSGCCGSREPADSRPVVIGLVIGSLLFAAGAVLWIGRASRSDDRP